MITGANGVNGGIWNLCSLCFLLFLPLHAAAAQNWTQTSAPITNWGSVACSADGTKILAAPGRSLHQSVAGPIFGSTNSGASWTMTGAPITSWASLACSADGTKIIAAVLGGIYASTNSGGTWTQTSAPITDWTSVACSADVENSALPNNRRQPLVASLRAAAASFERGDNVAGANQLHAFQNKVGAQVAPFDPGLAQEFIEAAQSARDSVENTAGQIEATRAEAQ